MARRCLNCKDNGYHNGDNIGLDDYLAVNYGLGGSGSIDIGDPLHDLHKEFARRFSAREATSVIQRRIKDTFGNDAEFQLFAGIFNGNVIAPLYQHLADSDLLKKKEASSTPRSDGRANKKYVYAVNTELLNGDINPTAKEVLAAYRKKVANAKKRWKGKYGPETRATLAEETKVLTGDLERILEELL